VGFHECKLRQDWGWNLIQARAHGGNMDNKELIAG
jgi:acetamidase/formamidase